MDNTVSYIARFQTVAMNLTPNPPGASLPLALKPSLTGTTLLWSATPLTYGGGAGLGTTVNGTRSAPARQRRTPRQVLFHHAGPNQFYVFGFTDADLNGSPLVPQALPDGRRTAR